MGMRWVGLVLAVGAALVLGGCGAGTTPRPVVTVYVTAPVGNTTSASATPTPMPSLPAVKTTTMAVAQLTDGVYSFLTPSKGIGCMILAGQSATQTVAAVRCDVKTSTWTVAAPTGGCPSGQTWGGAAGTGSVSLDGLPATPKVICRSDSVINDKAPVLAYGTGVTIGTLTCESRTSGVRCVASNGGGFDLARQSLVMACPVGQARIVTKNAANPCG